MRTPCKVFLGPPRTIQPCPGLAELVGRSHSGVGGGLKIEQRVNVDTCEDTRQLVIMFSGQHRKNGMVLNFCPICGESLLGLFADLVSEPSPAVASEVPPDPPPSGPAAPEAQDAARSSG